ncbi:hypothetical protein ARMGADRAFT_1086681 [Armillaria gallica]|uniref:Uncharacterized protein n=1 Tax=Armillaria gallica TaxID=47427 RepID=A0A2H3DD79_ARMGA|nr:hypothetical protein ARMGADRAFT_1086681 [Armillaria gallica]
MSIHPYTTAVEGMLHDVGNLLRPIRCASVRLGSRRPGDARSRKCDRRLVFNTDTLLVFGERLWHVSKDAPRLIQDDEMNPSRMVPSAYSRRIPPSVVFTVVSEDICLHGHLFALMNL